MKEPWLLHSMSVNALNFCGFAMCYDYDLSIRELTDSSSEAPAISKIKEELGRENPTQNKPMVFAVPNALDSGAIDFFHLPSEHRVSTLQADQEIKTGMVMALSLFHHSATEQLIVISGYEDGRTMVHTRQTLRNSGDAWLWKKVLVSQPHSQPLLSLDVSLSQDYFFTSSADAILARFAIPSTSLETTDAEQKPAKTLNTKHAGQQGLTVRSDGKIFSTAGWDAKIRVYSAKTIKELAVLTWHKMGCYVVAFARVEPSQNSGKGDTKALATKTTAVSVTNGSALDTIKHQRSAKAQSTHWLAAGGKDGKISLWDIY